MKKVKFYPTREWNFDDTSLEYNKQVEVILLQPKQWAKVLLGINEDSYNNMLISIKQLNYKLVKKRNNRTGVDYYEADRNR